MPRVCCWPIVLQNYFRKQNANIDSRHHSIGFNYRAFAAQHRVLQHNRPEGDICPFTVLHHRERASRPLLIAPGPADARTSISAMLFPNGSTRLASPTRSFCRCMATTSTMICAAAPRLPDAPPQNHGCDRLSARRLTRSSTVVAEMKGGRRCKTPSALGCRTCLFKAQCCPKTPFRRIPRSIYEEARDVARALAKTEAFERSRHDRKRVEMLFAHLKRILRLGRLRLRGPRGAQFEFTLAAIAQNLRRLAKLVARPPPLAAPCVV